MHILIHRDWGANTQGLNSSKTDGAPVLKEKKSRLGLPLLTKELSVTNLYLQRKKVIFSNGVPLGILSTFMDRPHVQL